MRSPKMIRGKNR